MGETDVINRRNQSVLDSSICDNMDEPGDIVLSEISHIHKEKHCMISLICGT